MSIDYKNVKGIAIQEFNKNDSRLMIANFKKSKSTAIVSGTLPALETGQEGPITDPLDAGNGGDHGRPITVDTSGHGPRRSRS